MIVNNNNHDKSLFWLLLLIFDFCAELIMIIFVDSVSNVITFNLNKY